MNKVKQNEAFVSKVIRIPKELKTVKRIDRASRDIKATGYAKSIERTRVSLQFEMLRKGQIVL